MQLILYLIIGAIPGFLLGGQFGILIGIIGGLLLCIVDQLNNIIEKLNNLHTVARKND